MNRKKIFRISTVLLGALHKLEQADENSATFHVNVVLDALKQFKTAIKESSKLTADVHNLLLQLDIIDNTELLTQSSFCADIKENVEQILKLLDINAPDMIFLLTAPFDEDARTGDGQYAKSLVKGFSQHSSTPCIWLKQKDQHYSIPCTPGLQPIPTNSIPTVSVLQPVANEHTVLSGYSCETNEKLKEAIHCIDRKITLRTPQVILGANNELLRIGFMSGTQKIIFGREDVVKRLASLSEQIAEHKTDSSGKTVEELNKGLTQITQYKSDTYRLLMLTSSSEPNVNEPPLVDSTNENNTPKRRTNKEKAVDLFEKMIQCSQQYGVSVSISKKTFEDSTKPEACLTAILKEWNLAVKKAKELKARLNELGEAELLLTSLQAAFEAPRYDKGELITALEQLSGIRESFYDFSTQKVGKRVQTKPNGTAEFYKVLEIAKEDEDRKNIINQLAETMIKLGEGKKLGVDIHIRTPDTGAFFMPADIEIFQQAGIRVNITVHEYKQNYTRRFLQKMLHDLLRNADSVLFFNEKDRHNAVSAAQNGDLDRERKDEHHWAITPYNLKDKAGLTVASQELSGTSLLTPKEVIQKEPNILSFGTIRPGKGFEEVLKIGIELKKRADSGLHNFKGVVIISGDPQDTNLMEQFFAERYGSENLKKYQKELKQSSIDYNTMDNKQKQNYWKKAKVALEKEVGNKLHNPYIEIHPWCELHELAELKNRSKYVCRMDDMGMRNNGSAIISVLDVGVIYTKWGTVTDHDYYPHSVKDHEKGIYGEAVDLGNKKYGLHQEAKKWNKKKKVESSYKRKPMARDPINDILPSIIGREENQQKYAHDLTESANYKTVVAAQKLLTERFTLQNGVLNLQQAFVLDGQEQPTQQLVDRVVPLSPQKPNRFSGIHGLSMQANRHVFFNEQQIWKSTQEALVIEDAVDNNSEIAEQIPTQGTASLNA